MNARAIVAVLVAFLAFAGYSLYITFNSDGFQAFDLNSQQYEAAAVAEPQPAPSPVAAPSAPAPPPSARPAAATAVVMPEERPFDPQDQPYESSEIPERLRHPERMFGPGLDNSEVDSAVAAGVASAASQATESAYSAFGPEMAQNGGSFMDGVIANDSELPTTYSAI